MNLSGPILPGQLRLIVSISLVYTLAWFAYFNQLPAGQFPGPEAEETLSAALSLAAGTTDEGAGYPLYTRILSVFAKFFNEASSLTLAARGLNAIALAVATGLAASAAGHYWKRNRAVWVTGLLIGLNPVLVFWAGIVSPCLLATASFTVAVSRLMTWMRGPKLKNSLWISFWLSIAAAFETTLLPFVVCWPLLAFFYTSRKRLEHLILSVSFPALAALVLLFSSIQFPTTPQLNFSEFGIRIYDALANHETYDGKSYGLYRQLHALLFVNPIHWGALFILLGAGLYSRLKDGYRGNSVLFCIGTLAIFALSYALNEGASQARATMIPLVAIFGSGVVIIPKIWKHAGLKTKRKIRIGAALLAIFAYSTHFGLREHPSWETDYVFLAGANIQSGNNERATTWADKALELNPNREDMHEIIVRAQFNEWALSNQPRTLPIETTREYLEQSAASPQTEIIETIRGIYHYKLREVDQANALWKKHAETDALALLCVYWTNNTEKPSKETIDSLRQHPYYPFLVQAISVNRNELQYQESERLFDNMLSFAY